MRKTLLTFMLAMLAVFGVAQTTYTDNLVVSINGESTPPMPATITLSEQANGLYTVMLKNFQLTAVNEENGEIETTPVGNIEIPDIEATPDDNGILNFTVERVINITEGDLEDAPGWLGPMLGDVPVNMTGKFTTDKFYTTIAIYMEMLDEDINVVFGDDRFYRSQTTYTDNLVVSINGESTPPMPATITLAEQLDGLYTVMLKNFQLTAVNEENGEIETTPVGNIEIPDIEATPDDNGILNFTVERVINITEGDLEDAPGWLGPMLGDVPVNMTGKFTADKFHTTIDIDMQETLGQTINVVFGDDDFVVAPDLSVKSLDELSNDKVYTLTNANGMGKAIYNPACSATNIWLGEATQIDDEHYVANDSYAEPVDALDANNNWQIVLHEGSYYLYNLGAEKFAVTGRPCTLQAEPVAINIVPVEGGFAFNTTEDATNFMCASPQLATPVAIWTSSDSGSAWVITENPNLQGDAEKVVGTITAISSATVETSAPAQGIYTLGGVKLRATDPRSLPKGIYVVNGKKMIK